MKKYIIPGISVICLSALLFLGITGFSTLTFQPSRETREYVNGQFIEDLRINFDRQIPIADFAISFWSRLKFTFFREGNKGVLTGDDNWLFTSEEYEINLGGDLNRAEYFRQITDVQSYFLQRDITLVLVLIPSKSRIYSNRIPAYVQSEQQLFRYSESVHALRNSGITVVNLEQPFMEMREKEQLFYKYDTHWTFEGARLSAEEIRREIDPLIIKEELSERSFILSVKRESLFKGDLLNYVPSLKVEWESFKETEIIDENPPVLGLFDTVEIPVILVGTSYSTDPRWNFENILKTTLKLDVLNLAEEGKGPFPSMNALVESQYYKEINSKIVVWEIPERYIPLQ